MRYYLHDLRLRDKLTLKQIADKLAITAQAYWAIEQGRRQSDMTLSTMERLAAAFNVEPEDIMRMEQQYRSSRDIA